MGSLAKQPLPVRTRGLIDKVLGKLAKLIEETESPFATESLEARDESNQRYLDAFWAFERQRAHMTAAIDDLVEAGYGGRYGHEEWVLESTWDEDKQMGQRPVQPYKVGDKPNAARIGFIYETVINARFPKKLTRGFAGMQLFWHHKLQDALQKVVEVCPDPQEPPAGNADDGPVAPNGFRWKGKVFRPIARGPFRALEAAWAYDARCVHKDDLAEVLGDAERLLPDNTMASIRGDLNEFFRAKRILLHAMVRDNRLAIQDGPPRPSKSKAKRINITRRR